MIAVQTRIQGVASCRLRPGEIAVDLFAGGGGASRGIELATGISPAIAVNHDAHAIEMHRANHPDTLHYCESVYDVKPRDVVGEHQVGLLWASPDCTHFSRAKGGKPRSKQIRGLAWVVVTWAAAVAPRIICLENVSEFLTWGPLDDLGQPIPDRAGETFREFVGQLQALGYAVEWRVLSAADYGAPTWRRRLFLVARRDSEPIRWPAPTNGVGLAPYRTAAECIDWSLECPSIFTRSRELKPATCRRIAHGVMRYVVEAAEPFIVNFRGTDSCQIRSSATGMDEPLRTITGCNHHALVSAFLAKHYTGVIGSAMSQPMGTVTSVDHHSLVSANLIEARTHGSDRGGPGAMRDLCEPLGTVMPRHGTALVSAFLQRYYSSGGQLSGCDQPAPTVTSKDRLGLVTVQIDGQTYAIADIGMRMLQPRELARAQGFPDSYVLTGTKTQQVARIGNSVCPPVATAVITANLDSVPPVIKRRLRRAA